MPLSDFLADVGHNLANVFGEVRARRAQAEHELLVAEINAAFQNPEVAADPGFQKNLQRHFGREEGTQAAQFIAHAAGLLQKADPFFSQMSGGGGGGTPPPQGQGGAPAGGPRDLSGAIIAGDLTGVGKGTPTPLAPPAEGAGASSAAGVPGASGQTRAEWIAQHLPPGAGYRVPGNRGTIQSTQPDSDRIFAETSAKAAAGEPFKAEDAARHEEGQTQREQIRAGAADRRAQATAKRSFKSALWRKVVGGKIDWSQMPPAGLGPDEAQARGYIFIGNMKAPDTRGVGERVGQFLGGGEPSTTPRVATEDASAPAGGAAPTAALPKGFTLRTP